MKRSVIMLMASPAPGLTLPGFLDAGTDYSEVNNLRLLHARVFDWLDRRLARSATDARLLC